MNAEGLSRYYMRVAGGCYNSRKQYSHVVLDSIAMRQGVRVIREIGTITP